MSVSAEPQRVGLTWEAFLELHEELLRHAELHDGEVVEMASPDRPHQLTLVNLIMALGPWVREHGGELVPERSTRRKDLFRKPTHYFSVDVQELWLVDCDERVFHVLHTDGDYHEWIDGDTVISSLLPGFEVPVADVISQVS
jgi:Uma2 family endonuclease